VRRFYQKPAVVSFDCETCCIDAHVSKLSIVDRVCKDWCSMLWFSDACCLSAVVGIWSRL